jgi:hypothetical protein
MVFYESYSYGIIINEFLFYMMTFRPRKTRILFMEGVFFSLSVHTNNCAVTLCDLHYLLEVGDILK